MNIKRWMHHKGLTPKDLFLLVAGMGGLIALNVLLIYGAVGSCAGWGTV
jgi:alpha-beta hydrolase superfamily lysophospholipase